MTALRAGGLRVKEYALIAAIFATSLLLWTASPLGALWLASRLTDDAFQIVFTAGCIFLPLLVAAFGFALARMNGAYLRTAGDRRRSVLDTSLVLSVIAAVLALLTFFLFFAHNMNPGNPGL